MVKSLDNGIYNEVQVNNTIVTFDPNANGEVRRVVIKSLSAWSDGYITTKTLVDSLNYITQKYGATAFATRLVRGA
jgi:hypothetical protein